MPASIIPVDLHSLLRAGTVIPALPLALDAQRRFDVRRQRALLRYQVDAGAGGIAVGVHSTQFAIRDPQVGLYAPLLEFAAQEIDAWAARTGRGLLRIAGVCGPTPQAVAEAGIARRHGYHLALVSLRDLAEADEEALVAHLRAVGEVLPTVGFYLQDAVGGRVLSYRFWRRAAELSSLAAIKIAPFNRHQTIDVVRAVDDAGRGGDLALYTGNDDTIVTDLLTSFRFAPGRAPLQIVGGLLGHWGVWTQAAVALFTRLRTLRAAGGPLPADILTLAAEVTDMNGALFDAANGFHGCIPGIHEVLRRQGLLEGIWCLDPRETLSPGQADELTRVCRAYPHLTDDAFVRANLATWLAD